MLFTPFDNNIIVKKENDIDQSAGGILLVQRPTSVPCIGTVLAAGPGIYNDDDEFVPNPIKEGDRIAFGDADKKPLDPNDKNLIMIPGEHVYGILTGDKADDTVIPVHNVIIVEKESDPGETAGGIKLAKRPDFMACIGKVILAGPGIHDEYGKFHPVKVKPGDRIAYSFTFQKTFDINNSDVVMLLPGGIYGVLPPEA